MGKTYKSLIINSFVTVNCQHSIVNIVFSFDLLFETVVLNFSLADSDRFASCNKEVLLGDCFDGILT